jgi:hypothetical protein
MRTYVRRAVKSCFPLRAQNRLALDPLADVFAGDAQSPGGHHMYPASEQLLSAIGRHFQMIVAPSLLEAWSFECYAPWRENRMHLKGGRHLVGVGAQGEPRVLLSEQAASRRMFLPESRRSGAQVCRPCGTPFGRGQPPLMPARSRAGCVINDVAGISTCRSWTE